MIVHPEGDERLRLITQPDHAYFAADLLGLWRADGLPAHPRRAEILFAVREHDNGWRETDAAPRWAAALAAPHDFISIPDRERRAIWQRATTRFAADHPYATLLIGHHARTLNHDHREQPGWRDFFAALDEREADLRAAAGAGEPEIAADYRFLDWGDFASLAVCQGDAGFSRFDRHGVKGALGTPGELALSPFPLAGATTFTLPCRRIPRRAYAGDADLGGELAAARWEALKIRVVPPAPDAS